MKKILKKLSVLMAVVVAVRFIPAQVLLPLQVQADEAKTQLAADNAYNTVEAAADYLKTQMLERKETISVQVDSSYVTDLESVVRGIMDKAVEYKRGDSGSAGDALKSSMAGWGCESSITQDVYTITYSVNYLTTAEQEEQLTKAVKEALAGLGLDGKTTSEKIRSIYDYICDNVDYDYDGLSDSNNKIKYTAYSALINGKAVCEGYAALFYRMCMDSGIQARIVSGLGNGGAHAWNIVEINGYYYNIDSTWDGQDSVTTHNYFLKNMQDFSDHVRDSEFNTAEFNAAFPMAENSYIDYGAVEKALNVENFDYTFTTTDGAEVSTSASDKAKVLVFFSSSCKNSEATICSLAVADFSDVDMIYINTLESGDKETTESFRDNYGKSSMTFCEYANWNVSAMWRYAGAMPGYVSGSSVYWPVIAYIDSNNMLQMVTSGYSGAGTIRNYVNYYCKGMTNSLPHNHIYSDEWSMDADSHWHACVAEGCDGSVDSKASHIAGEWIVDKEATASENGSRHKECTVCGYIMERESIEKPTEPETTTQAPTEKPTEAETTTQAPTEKPTEAETTTEAPTEKPTEAETTTEAPTEKPTEAETTTEAPTEKPTEVETTTEAPIEKPTEPETTTEAPTEKPTEAETTTEVPTEKPTEAETTTEAPTEKPTEAETTTEAPTEKPTEAETTTQAPTEKPTEAETTTEAPTEKPTEAETTTQAPTEAPAKPENPIDNSVLDDINSGEKVVTAEVKAGNGSVVPTDFVTAVIEKGAQLVLEVKSTDGKPIVKYTIDGSKFKKAPDANLKLDVTCGEKNAVTEKVKEQLKTSSDNSLFLCSFEHSGELNGELGVTVYPGFDKGTELKLFYYNDAAGKAEDMGQTVRVAEDGSVTFTVTHFSSYLLVKADDITTDEPDNTPNESEPETTQPDNTPNDSQQETTAEPESGSYIAPSTGAGTGAAALVGVMLMACGAAGVCLRRKKQN